MRLEIMQYRQPQKKNQTRKIIRKQEVEAEDQRKMEISHIGN